MDELADITNHPRKRQKNESEWKKAKAKVRRNSGEGKRAAVTCQHMPHSFCKAASLTAGDVDDIFHALFKDSNKERQDAFLAAHIILSPVVRRRGSEQPKRARNFSPTFFISTQGGERAEVCSATFHSIFAVGRKRVGNIMKFAFENSNNPRPENRGGPRANDRAQVVKEKIKAHIKSFRCCASHYGRGKTPHKRYLPSTLSIFQMSELYNKENPNDAASYTTYWRVFSNCFNLGFGNPKTDVCSYCVAQKAKIASEENEKKKKEPVTELIVHRCRAKKFYELMRTKPDNGTMMVSFDLMQNQALPKTPVGEAYYARQLWLYVLGVIEHKPGGDEVAGSQDVGDVHFYIWGEQEMGRRANQVASALHDFLERRLTEDPQIKHVHLFSDSCVGQNKNSTFLGVLTMLAVKHDVQIEHTFPVRGHSYMPADRAFGKVEKKLRRIERILLPSEYLEEYAQVGRVHVHDQDWHADNYKDAIEKFIKKPLPFKITEAKRIKMDPMTGCVTVCNFYSAQGEKYSILKRGKKRSHVKSIPLQLESCVKAAKQSGVKKLLLAIGIDIEDNNEAAKQGPLPYLETVKKCYAAIFVEDAMDIDDDSDEDEATVNLYDE